MCFEREGQQVGNLPISRKIEQARLQIWVHMHHVLEISQN